MDDIFLSRFVLSALIFRHLLLITNYSKICNAVLQTLKFREGLGPLDIKSSSSAG